MSTLPSMPDKWAVKIESVEMAMALQLLFLDYKGAVQTFQDAYASKGNWYPFAMNVKTNKVNKVGVWNWCTIDYYEEYGYTIYTLSQLKELLK